MCMRTRLTGGQAAAGGGLFLHRHQSGGPRRRREARCGGFQFAILQQPQCGYACVRVRVRMAAIMVGSNHISLVI